MPWQAVSRRLIAAPSVGTVVGSLLVGGTGFLECRAVASEPPKPVPPIPSNPLEDFCGDQCSHALPPGQNGNMTLAELVAHRLFS